MTHRILFVDDEPNILAAIKRNLGLDYEVETAVGPIEGLAAVQGQGPFAVVVSDQRMPQMEGITFLEKVREMAKDSVRVMLTGHADLDTAIDAVNKGQIFRFLTKPCDDATMRQALDASLEQYRLIMSERELLRGTLRGSIKIMGEIIQLIKPEVAGRIQAISPFVSKVAKMLDAPNAWEIDIATELCLLGQIILPDSIVRRVNRGKALSPEEFETFRTHLEVAEALVMNIPRLENVAKILRYQNKNFNGSGLPEDDVKEKDIPLGSRILRVMLDFDWQVLAAKDNTKAALAAMQSVPGRYDPDVLAALDMVLTAEAVRPIKSVPFWALQEGMVLASDIYIDLGNKRVKALAQGHVLTTRIIDRLKYIKKNCAMPDTIKVYAL